METLLVDLADLTILKRQYPVCKREACWSVRDENDCPAHKSALAGFHKSRFPFKIIHRRSFIENNDRRVAEKRTSKSKPLALPPRQPDAVIADLGLVPFGQCTDKIMGLCQSRRARDFRLR